MSLEGGAHNIQGVCCRVADRSLRALHMISKVLVFGAVNVMCQCRVVYMRSKVLVFGCVALGTVFLPLLFDGVLSPLLFFNREATQFDPRRFYHFPRMQLVAKRCNRFTTNLKTVHPVLPQTLKRFTPFCHKP